MKRESEPRLSGCFLMVVDCVTPRGFIRVTFFEKDNRSGLKVLRPMEEVEMMVFALNSRI